MPLHSLLCILCIVFPTCPGSRRRDRTRRLWLRSVRIYSRNGECIPKMRLLLKNKRETANLEETDSPLLVTTVCLWCEFDDGVQRHLYVGQVGLR